MYKCVYHHCPTNYIHMHIHVGTMYVHDCVCVSCVGVLDWSQYPPSGRDILLDNAHCSGSEESILDCPALNSVSGDTVHCSNSKEAAVQCGGLLVIY